MSTPYIRALRRRRRHALLVAIIPITGALAFFSELVRWWLQ